MHRGYRIEELAKNCSYLEVCYLLLNGDLPTAQELVKFNAAVLSHMMLHEKLVQLLPRVQGWCSPHEHYGRGSGLFVSLL